MSEFFVNQTGGIMFFPMRLLLIVAALSIFPSRVVAQTSQPDPAIRELQDSISKLTRQIASRDSSLQAAAGVMPLPEFDIINSVVYGDRGVITVTLNGQGILRAILYRADNGAPIDTVTKNEYARTHRIEFDRLGTPATYHVELRLLRVGGAPSERFRTGRPGGQHHPRLVLSALAATTPPVPMVSDPVVRGTTVELSVETPVNALIQARLHRADPRTGGMLPDTVATQGDALLTDAETGAAKTVPSRRKTTLRFTQLDTTARYYYVVEAMDASGKRATMADGFGSFQTGTNPAEFGFKGPLQIRVNPAVGLVLQWSSTTAADSGRVRIIPRSGGGAWVPAILNAEKTTLTAQIPRAVPGDTTGVPVIEVEMFGLNGGPRRFIQFTIGLEQPTQPQISALRDSRARDVVRDLSTAMGGGDAGVNWKQVLTTGAGLLLKVLPAVVP